MSWSSYYDDLAATYDEATAGDWRPNERLRDLLAGLGITPRSVLDLGAGTGQTAAVLASLYPDARLTLVEGSAGMAAVATRALPDATVVVGDLDAHLAGDPATYDLVVSVGVLELVPSLQATLSGATARLAPGGYLAVTHEPLLEGSAVQGEAETVLPRAPGCAVRRHERAVVEGWATDLGLVRVAATDFVAYHRGDGDGAVYEAVVWRLGQASGAGA